MEVLHHFLGSHTLELLICRWFSCTPLSVSVMRQPDQAMKLQDVHTAEMKGGRFVEDLTPLPAGADIGLWFILCRSAGVEKESLHQS